MPTEKERKLGYAYAIGASEGEGFPHSEDVLKKALRLNPESPIGRAMRAKVPRDSKVALPEDYKEGELQKIGEEVIEAQNAFDAGRFEGTKKEPLPPYEIKELRRRINLIKGGVGSVADLENQRLVLKAEVSRLLSCGYKIDEELEKEIEKLTEGV